MIQRTVLASSIAAAIALACGPLQAAPFQNGSFEIGTTGDEQTTVPTFWTGQVEYFNPATYGLGAAPDGTKIVDLAWFTSNPSTGNLSQTFDTVSGQLYRVDFQAGTSDLAGRGGASSLSVGTIGSYAGGAFAIGATSSVPIVWSAQSFQFTATGASSTLSFSSTVNSFQRFAFVDNVSVTPVPEPGAYALAMAGLGVLGLIGRRRRSA